MGNVSIKNGIGFSEASGARFFDMSAVTTVADMERNEAIKPVIPDDKLATKPWSPWGKNNLLPQEMIADIEACAILNSIIDMQMRFGISNGPVPVKTILDKKTGQRVIDEYIEDAEIEDFLEGNNMYFQSQGWIKDQLGFANGAGRYGLNKDRSKIINLQRDDITEMRYNKKNSKGIIRNIWLSAEWNKVMSETDSRVFSVPLLSNNRPDVDLQRQMKYIKSNEFAFTFRYPGWGKHYYSMPLWYAAHKWVKIAQGVPEMKAAIFENSIHVKYVVVIYEKYWEKYFPGWTGDKYTPEQKEKLKDKVYDDIDNFLVGSKNAYKSIFADGYRDAQGNLVSDIEIKPVDDTMKDGKLLPDSAAANSEIAFAMHFNPAIFGGNQKAGLYQQETGGSSVRESGLMQVIMMEIERQNIRRALYVPKKFNKWDVKYPGLDFIIPATVLTTLDTGAGSKPILTGDTKPQQ